MNRGTIGGILFAVSIGVMVSAGLYSQDQQQDTAKFAHDAGVDFLHLMGEEFEAAAHMDANGAFSHIDSAKKAAFNNVFAIPIGERLTAAAYGPDSDNDEVDLDALQNELNGIATGLKSVR
jgi:hypothetical protein